MSNSTAMDFKDINRSEGEGMGTTSYHNTLNTQSGDDSSNNNNMMMNSQSNEIKWSEALKDERKFGDKMIAIGDKVTNKLNETDAKVGFTKKMNELDQKYGVTHKLEKTALKTSDIAVHFGRALSRGQVKQAFLHSFDAGRIGECERKKHDSKGLGPPAWIPESDKEGLVEGSVGKEPSWNELFEKEAEEANKRDLQALNELNLNKQS